ncbi:MAG: IclR family transcriptional regulator [Burkholderiaceae bacterium]|nr:IclR family transcriptional regulator [Burkholderiaceae bacterium]
MNRVRPAVAAAPPRIQALVRADALVGAVVELAGAGAVTLTDLAAHTGLNKVTAFNLLQTLVALGYLEQEAGSRRYRIGLRTLELAGHARSGRDLARLCEPALHGLCRDTGETVNLAVPYHGYAMIVDSVEGRHGIRTTAYAGAKSPYHSTACGKVLLAFMAADLQESLLTSIRLEPKTPATIVDRGALLLELESIRSCGWAFDFEENEVGAHCVAVPIFGADGRPCAAISVSGLKDRMDPTVLEAIARNASYTAATISRALGSDRQPPSARQAIAA